MQENHTIDRYRRERDEQALRRQETEAELLRITEERDSLAAKLNAYIIVKGQSLACSQYVSDAFDAIRKERDALADEIAKEQDQRIGMQLTLTSALEKLKAARSEIERKDAALKSIKSIADLTSDGCAIFDLANAALSPAEEGKEAR